MENIISSQCPTEVIQVHTASKVCVFKCDWTICDTYFYFRYHYKPIPNTAIFKTVKFDNFHMKKFDSFVIFAHGRGSSNEYPQSMF